jgi:hypothetical protein
LGESLDLAMLPAPPRPWDANEELIVGAVIGTLWFECYRLGESVEDYIRKVG